MDWKKNDRIQITIEDMSDTGEGIGKTDGFTWFVKDAVMGDRIEAGVMKMKKSYGFARLIQVLQPSPCRIAPRCPVARQCGGCQLQAMDYGCQLRYKEKKLLNNLRRIGGMAKLLAPGETPGEGQVAMEPIIGMENPWRYRNKAQFPFGRDRNGNTITGFYAGRTHRIVENEDCLLGVEENRLILDCIRSYMKEYGILPYDEESHSGLLRHVLIRKGFQTGELMVCLVINGEAEELGNGNVLSERLRNAVRTVWEAEEGKMGLGTQEAEEGKMGLGTQEAEGGQMGLGTQEAEGGQMGPGTQEAEEGQKRSEVPHVASISCSINRERTNVIMGKQIVNLFGPGYITDFIGSIQYRISPLSFYQVNPRQTERLYALALEYAGLTGRETVWDLYCGIGTISLFLAQKAKRVYGVEIVPQAIDDARENARINGIENVEFFVGKAEEVLPEQYEKNHVYADVIVVDPPRKGCDSVCLDTIVKMGPEKVVYVSCDSATLARDVKYLGERGYQVRRVRGVDMFGWTVGCETVVLLSKEEAGSPKGA